VHDLDLDLGSGHTAYRRASLIDLYLHTKFHRNRKNFLCAYGVDLKIALTVAKQTNVTQLNMMRWRLSCAYEHTRQWYRIIK